MLQGEGQDCSACYRVKVRTVIRVRVLWGRMHYTPGARRKVSSGGYEEEQAYWWRAWPTGPITWWRAWQTLPSPLSGAPPNRGS